MKYLLIVIAVIFAGCKDGKPTNAFILNTYKLQEAKVEDKRQELTHTENVSLKKPEVWKPQLKKCIYQLKDKQAFEVEAWCGVESKNGALGFGVFSDFYGISKLSGGFAVVDEQNNLLIKFDSIDEARSYIHKQVENQLLESLKETYERISDDLEEWNDSDANPN